MVVSVFLFLEEIAFSQIYRISTVVPRLRISDLNDPVTQLCPAQFWNKCS